MKKTRAFSILLLKQQYDATNALKDDHALADDVEADELPADAKLFVLDAKPRPPWWRDYFGINNDLLQGAKGALVFLPVGGRTFVLSFGFVVHNLKDGSYEYDFGLRVTLNCVDPGKLKNTDTLEPGAARRQRTQMAMDSDLTYFDFDRDSNILKSLTGKSKAEYQNLMKHATGANNLRIKSPLPASELSTLCEKLLELYADDAYRSTFPDIQNITPVRDPTIIAQLNAILLDAFHQKTSELYLAVPAILDYGDNLYTMFGGAGASLIYDDVFLGRYYEYLSDRGIDHSTMTVDDLDRHVLKVTDENGDPRKAYSILRSLIFDTTMAKGGDAYHLVEGDWYRVAKNYVERLSTFLDPFHSAVTLPDYDHKSEGAYNEAVAAANGAFLCLDRSDISPPGQSQVEPCDLYSVDNDHAVLHHVKVSTFSADLSHLFNQGTNAIALLKSDDEVREKLRSLVADKAGKALTGKLTKPIDDGSFRVVFAMVTHKDTALKSENLPLFSRISLMRNLKALLRMDVAASFGYVPDKSPKKEGKKKPRKPKATAVS